MVTKYKKTKKNKKGKKYSNKTKVMRGGAPKYGEPPSEAAPKMKGPEIPRKRIEKSNIGSPSNLKKMKKIIIALAFALSIASCKKEDAKVCNCGFSRTGKTRHPDCARFLVFNIFSF